MPKTEQRLFYSAAPIVIAAFDDAPSLKRTLEDLARCSDATATKVVIYIDGPRNERDKPYVIQTINAAINAQGFRRRLVIKMEQHLGREALKAYGATLLAKRYGKVISIIPGAEIRKDTLAVLNSALDACSDRQFVTLEGCVEKSRDGIPSERELLIWGARKESMPDLNLNFMRDEHQYENLVLEEAANKRAA